MTALILVLALMGVQGAHADTTFISVGTSLGPLGIDGGGAFGGSVRVGKELGPLRPFVGGQWSTLTMVSRDEDGVETSDSKYRLWSGQGGASLGFTSRTGARPYAVGGLHLLRASVDDRERDRQAVYENGIGVFGGVGAEAPLSDIARAGLEVGLLHSRSSQFEDDWSDVRASTSWIYSYLHLTILL